MTFTQVWYENEHYQVGTIVTEDEDTGGDVFFYGVLNKLSGVLEDTSTELPRLVVYAAQGSGILSQFLSQDPELDGLEVPEEEVH